ncbi:MAG: type VII secretion-associated serine protease mycosin [Gordonia sp.]|nr:type VII secretion-associated serine protease mycosin [Gordonia sp. (in: high G+C Gram-positive bacteria)]
MRRHHAGARAGSTRSRIVRASVVVATAALTALPALPAAAIPPPAVDIAALVRDAPVAPPEPTEQKMLCAKPVLSPGTDITEPSAAQAMMRLPEAWRFSRGGGQRVAVIDTGVTRHPRLPRITAGGDYVSRSDGTDDCDGHGTLVAGIIGAQPAPGDAFAGVAPESSIIAIRQSSAAFEPKDRKRAADSGDNPSVGTGFGTVQTLAYAIVRAVGLGATVINISEVACGPSGSNLFDKQLGAAVKYAFDRNVVVVAAAGNLIANSQCSQQNPSPNPADPGLDGWDTVTTIASPAWYTPYVLSVAAVESEGGSPAEFSLAGPWVGVAAPGTSILSLDSTRGSNRLVNAQEGEQGLVSVDGTSFAAPYVSGVVALVRAKFPELDAAEVIERIARTAHAPGTGRDNTVGHGVIDPVAALTYEISDTETDWTVPQSISAPAVPPPADHRPQAIAVIGVGVCAVVLTAGWAVSMPARRLRRLDPEEY